MILMCCELKKHWHKKSAVELYKYMLWLNSGSYILLIKTWSFSQKQHI